jgi:hypothetical protein
MTRYYSIEVKFSYEDIVEEEIDIKAEQAKKQIEQLAEKADGEFCAFDEDIGINAINGNMSRLCLNYNWKFVSLHKIIQFISSLPNHYKILWIHNNDNKKKDSTYIIYSTFTPLKI